MAFTKVPEGEPIPLFGVPNHIQRFGGYLDRGNLGRCVAKSPRFRVRNKGQEETEAFVTESDLVPVKLSLEGLLKTKLPDVHEVNMGLEMEFSVVDKAGRPVSLYGDDIFYQDKGRVELQYTQTPWLLERMHGVTPELMHWQAEVGVKEAPTWAKLEASVLAALRPVYNVCREEELYLVPTGMLGEKIFPDWTTITPHPYMGKIIQHSLGEEGLTFDANTTQAHVDLRPFGKVAEFGLFAGNVYNALLASMFNGLATSAPFQGGEITQLLSNREWLRNKLATQGGVQGDLPVNGARHFWHGVERVRRGEIPAPERGGNYFTKEEGSHKDTRSAKYSTGTFEAGATDMHPNLDFWIAQAVILRQFVWKIAESITDNKPLPEFLIGTAFSTRQANRLQASVNGNQAVFQTREGRMTMAEAWQRFFDWVKPPEFDEDWKRAEAVIHTLLEPTPIKAIDHINLLDIRGNFANTMLAFVDKLSGTSEEKIHQVNAIVGELFMEKLGKRLRTA